ncbi:MAG: hypothetical protein BGO69_13425 [Bacteroidetes bacterium 46-16]|nr:MAG: hypothetical protein BGO69_13425 [Bacteroidetes bacterium 46-16]
MKKSLILIVLVFSFVFAQAQNPTYQQKLYYTCKIWGFTKYYHSRVSNCQVNWDSVLLARLPLIKNAVTFNDFNNELIAMLSAAGPMDIAANPLPDTIAPELKRNRNWNWINDPMLRTDVQVVLDTIKNNFRPHPICWVHDNDYNNPNYYGWLVFPYDSLMSNSNFYTNYPDEWNRLLTIFKHWNIINYFNPYNYVLDKPWDTTLYNNIADIAAAPDYPTFVTSFKRMTGAMNDAHTEGLTWTNYYLFPGFYTVPLVLRYIENKYVVVKSGIPGVSVGDEIVSVDGLSAQQWEDSLSTYVSAGNPSVFRRFMCQYIIAGNYNSLAAIVYKDASNIDHTINPIRNHSPYEPFYDYYPNDTLANTTWTTLDCGVVYANIGNLYNSDADVMYNIHHDAPAMIIDIRNYPVDASVWDLLYQMLDGPKFFAKFTIPDVTYPGTFYWDNDTIGYANNPVPYNGKIIVLFNQETQSAAEFDCMGLQAMPNVELIGSQTAGADGNVTFFKLSQDLHAGFTTLGVYYPNGDSTQRIGIVPDTIVTPTQAGIRQGRDEVLEVAMDKACQAASVQGPQGLQAGINIYPNPASETVNIDAVNTGTGNVQVLISDITGKILLGKEFDVTGKEMHGSLDVRSLASGVYILEIKTAAGRLIRKFVKE